MRRRIPLAWKQLTKERGRMFVAIVGIAFAELKLPDTVMFDAGADHSTILYQR
jgi:hypothetical protein